MATPKVVLVVLIVKMMIATSLQAQLGMEDGRITDAQITASSCYDVNHCTDRARLNQPQSGVKRGAWSARTNNQDQYIQVDLRQLHEVTGVMTQGRNGHSQWVTTFRVLYSLDGLIWTTAENATMAGSDIFNGNSDRDTIVTNDFTNELVARFIRIEPVTWANHISMRFELLGRVTSKIEGPQKDLGMRNGQIPDSAITASSEYDSNQGPDRSRLEITASGAKKGAWSARTNDANQWLQVDFNSFYIVTGVITQGRQDHSQWVTSFRVAYSDDGRNWNIIQDCNGNEKVFTGNTDRNGKVTTLFSRPVISRFLRIHPTTWHGHISMRLEILGKGAVANNRFEPLKLGMEDGRIATLNQVAATAPGKLGIEDGRVATTSLSASSCWDGNHCVARSRLNQPQVGSLRGAWSALTNDLNQWIQVDLRAAFEVTGVITQGRNGLDQWVRFYEISYSIDGKDWTLVKDFQGGPKIYAGNADRDSLVENAINPPVTARFFRLHPLTWQGHISLRWELIGEGPIMISGSSQKLGLEDYRIPDSAITASSQWDSNHGPRRARLNLPRSGALRGAWSALTLDHSQWLQVDLRGTYRVTGIITQGRAKLDQWVTSYKVAHSMNGQDFTTVTSPGSQQEKVFTGNNDRSTQVTHNFDPPLTTRFVRVLPYMWHGHISMRMELLGAGPVAAILNDPVPLGLESTVIPDSSLTASSQWDADHGPKRARLNLARVGKLRGAWSAQANNANQWIQVDLLDPYRIIAVATQGRQDVDQWVTSYKLACSNDGVTFDTVQGICIKPGADRIFTGNADRNTVVTNTLPVPEVCRYVRLLPATWHGHISLRMELYGEGPLTV